MERLTYEEAIERLAAYEDCFPLERAQELAVLLNSQGDDEYDGLKVKYRVFKARNGELVGNCFVLRPDKDEVAYIALMEYARRTPNDELSDDISNWLTSIAVEKAAMQEGEA